MAKSAETILQDGDRGNHTRLPNLIYNLGLTPFEFTLYAHLRRVIGEDASGKCWKSTATLASETNMSEGMVSKAKESLAAPRALGKGRPKKPLIVVTEEPNRKGGHPRHVITLTDIWRENGRLKEGPQDPLATSPHELATSPHELATSPHELATSPHELATSPHELGNSYNKTPNEQDSNEQDSLKQQQEAAAALVSVETFILEQIAALAAQGVEAERELIGRLVRQHGAEKVANQVRWLPQRSGDNRIAILVASLKGKGYEDPAKHRAKPKAQQHAPAAQGAQRRDQGDIRIPKGASQSQMLALCRQHGFRPVLDRLQDLHTQSRRAHLAEHLLTQQAETIAWLECQQQATQSQTAQSTEEDT